MSDIEDEVASLHQEFEWLLREEVSVILEQLHAIVLECARRFPSAEQFGVESLVKNEKFLLSNSSTSSSGSSSSDTIQAVVTLVGDDICHADISLRLHKHPVPSHRTIVQNDCQWKLQQIQDAGNHLTLALQLFSSRPYSPDKKLDFETADQVIRVVDDLMSCLRRGRSCLLIPKKRTINELKSSRNIKSLQPPLPPDLAVSFYVQAHKLVFAVYHIISKESQGPLKFDVFQAESSVPWLSEVLVLFTVSLQLCQQLKNKVAVFAQFKEMHSSPTGKEE